MLSGLGRGVNRVATDFPKRLTITDQTYYRWRKEYGGLRVDQAMRLKGARAGDLSSQRAAEWAIFALVRL